MNKKARIAVVLLCSLLYCSLFAEQTLGTDKAEREGVVEKLTTLISLLRDGYAHEYKEARGIHIFRTSAGSSVAVAIFTIEGFADGNNYSQFMAVFATLGTKLEGQPPRPLSLLDVMAVGGKGWRSVDPKNVLISSRGDEISINLDTREYAPQDPMCCPSKKSKAVYVIRPHVRGRLKELD
jgi:hypothetical protein